MLDFLERGRAARVRRSATAWAPIFWATLAVATGCSPLVDSGGVDHDRRAAMSRPQHPDAPDSKVPPHSELAGATTSPASLQLARGNAALRDGHFALADHHFSAALDRCSHDVQALNSLAVVYQQQGRLREAVALYREALRLRTAAGLADCGQ
jgi:tetratricopeptide (TPR) repeat protein